MAVISLKCNSSSWACSLAKGNIDGSYHFGFTPGNFLQLAFPCTKDFRAKSIHFAFAIYLLSISGGKGRVSTETPLRIVLITPMHVKALSSLNSVSLFFPVMMRSWLKHSLFLPWIWNTPSICLSLHSLVSFPVLSKSLSIDNLTVWGGLA